MSFTLALLTFLLYLPVRQAQFLVYDDKGYILDNGFIQHGLNEDMISWAMGGGYMSNWHPLTWMSHALDCQLFGLTPRGPHLVNAFLHSGNTALLFLLLVSLTGAFWRSMVVAALFGWHPTHVESVAWVSERKDVLSALFFLATLLAYVRYSKRGGWIARLAVVILFAMGLMSKPMLVSLPILLLLLDFWPLNRMTLSKNTGWPERDVFLMLLREKWPLMFMSAVSCMVTYYVQWQEGATQALTVDSTVRCLNAVISCAGYISKLFLPVHLSAFYPYPKSLGFVDVLVSGIVLGIITFLANSRRRQNPYMITGWLWFLISLLPVIGLIQVGKQAMADRYLYIPSIGIFVALVWWMAECFQGANSRRWLVTLAIAELVFCVLLTRQEMGYWMDSIRLFSRAIEVTRENGMAERSLGIAYIYAGKSQESIPHLEKAIQYDDKDSQSMSDLGFCYAMQSKHSLATNLFSRALSVNPRNPKAHYNFGMSCMALGDYSNAVVQFKEAAKLTPGVGEVRAELGKAYVGLGEFASAASELAEANRLNPGNAESCFNMGLAQEGLGHPAEACLHYSKAIELNPSDARAFNNLAWIRCSSAEPTMLNGREAVRLATRACELTGYKASVYLGTLANAHASAGNYSEAVAVAKQAIQQAEASGQSDIARRNQELVEIYQSGRAFREAAR